MTKPSQPAAVKRRTSHSSAPSSARTEEFAAVNPAKAQYHLQLYVTGTTPRSTQAIANLRAICEEHLAGRYELEVIDLYTEPARAAAGQVIASPTLVKTLPKPLMRMVGNLANRAQLMIKLNLTPGSAESTIRNLA